MSIADRDDIGAPAGARAKRPRPAIIEHDSTVANDRRASTLPNGVRRVEDITPNTYPGCTLFVHYNGPTDQLSAVSMGMVVLDPGAAPHEPHRHPEEEFMLVASGAGEIVCDGKTTQAGPGSVMYCAGDVLHGIVNTGVVPLTFYWSKWMAKAS
jgi:mannose-6-phosphate isomerase-like protein (cupin superfamily)